MGFVLNCKLKNEPPFNLKNKKKKKKVQKISYMIQQALEIRDFEMEKMIFPDFGEDQS